MSKEPKKDEIKRYRRKRRSPNVPTHYSQIKVGKPKGSGGPTEEMIRQAFVACSQFGCTNAELGKLLNMSTGMIQKWIMNVSPFREAVLAGRDQYDNRVVEKSLRERAQGYNKKIREIRRDNEGKTTNIEKEIYIPPDTKAAIFWLSRRHPER